MSGLARPLIRAGPNKLSGKPERMTAARLGRRQTQNEEIAALKAENARLKAQVESLRRELAAAKERAGCH